jgi:hypothetical protein
MIEYLDNVCDVCGLDYPDWALEYDDYGEQICRYCLLPSVEDE